MNPSPEAPGPGQSGVTVRHLGPTPTGHERYEVTSGQGEAGHVEVLLVTRSHLRHAYPVSRHDHLVSPIGVDAEGLRRVTREVLRADPACRRVVCAPLLDDLAAIRLAEDAGYRYVVDAEVDGQELALLAAEPEWLLEQIKHLDDVPDR